MADKNATTLAAIWTILGVMLDEEFTLEEKLDKAREVHALASIEIEELEQETAPETAAGPGWGELRFDDWALHAGLSDDAGALNVYIRNQKDAEVLQRYTEALAHLSGMPCCPGCGALAEGYTLVAAEGEDPDAGPPWRCTECGLVFDEFGEC